MLQAHNGLKDVFKHTINTKMEKMNKPQQVKGPSLPMSSYINVLKQPVLSHLDAQIPFGIRQGDEGLAYQQSEAIGLQYHIY